MRVLGLTGNIACGKSTVARLLAEAGALVIDADLLVRELYADPAFAARVAAQFGAGVLDSAGVVDRVALGNIVFNDAAALARLEALVHPAVAALRDAKLRALGALPEPPPAAVIEAVKLVEAGQAGSCDAVWCVVCAPDLQRRRLREQRGLSEAEADIRLPAQPSLEAKRAILGNIPLVLIPNDGSLDELRLAVRTEWERFLSSGESR